MVASPSNINLYKRIAINPVCDWRDLRITVPQQELIELIEDAVHIRFNGICRGDASDYIDSYKEEWLRIQKYKHNPPTCTIVTDYFNGYEDGCHLYNQVSD